MGLLIYVTELSVWKFNIVVEPGVPRSIGFLSTQWCRFSCRDITLMLTRTHGHGKLARRIVGGNNRVGQSQWTVMPPMFLSLPFNFNAAMSYVCISTCTMVSWGDAVACARIIHSRTNLREIPVPFRERQDSSCGNFCSFTLWCGGAGICAELSLCRFASAFSRVQPSDWSTSLSYHPRVCLHRCYTLISASVDMSNWPNWLLKLVGCMRVAVGTLILSLDLKFRSKPEF